MCLLGGVLTFSVLDCSELQFSDYLSTACSVGMPPLEVGTSVGVVTSVGVTEELLEVGNISLCSLGRNFSIRCHDNCHN